MHGSDTTRRQFLRTTATGAAGVACGGLAGVALADERLPPVGVRRSYWEPFRERMLAEGAPKGSMRGIELVSIEAAARYLTDPERIARMLPPYLEPDDQPEVQIDWIISMTKWEDSVPGYPYWLYTEGDMFVSGKYKGNRCMVDLALVLEQDYGRTAGRESVELRKKEGMMNIDIVGNRLRAWTSRQGRLLCAMETEITDEPAHPTCFVREVGWGWMRCAYRLNPDWREGLIENEVQVWRNFGFDLGYPTGMPPAEYLDYCPRAGDLRKTKLILGAADGVEPWGEFPVRKLLGVSFTRGQKGRIMVPRGPNNELFRYSQYGQDNKRILLEKRDPEEFAPWAFLERGYDRPITRGKVWVPVGWPEQASAYKLTPELIERWRAREFMELNPADIVDMTLEIDPAVHRKTLPPPCEPTAEPQVRILAVHAHQSDFSTLPITELWLLSRCRYQGEESWYPVSQIVGRDADVLLGRETYGYPTKVGAPEIQVRPMQIDILGQRFLRDFLYVTIPLGLDDPAPDERDLQLVAIRPEIMGTMPRGRFVTQPWKIAIAQAKTCRPEFVRLTFPDAPPHGNIGMNEPWFEFKDSRILSVIVGSGAVRRYPGRLRDKIDQEKVGPFLADRIDGPGTTYHATYLLGP